MQTLDALSNAAGYVALQQEFAIAATSPDFITLEYTHPVGEFLPEAPRVRIQLVCDVNALTDSGRVNFRPGATVKISSVGNVVRWDRANMSLAVSPIAVY